MHSASTSRGETIIDELRQAMRHAAECRPTGYAWPSLTNPFANLGNPAAKPAGMSCYDSPSGQASFAARTV